jgi:hypothetical protein
MAGYRARSQSFSKQSTTRVTRSSCVVHQIVDFVGVEIVEHASIEYVFAEATPIETLECGIFSECFGFVPPRIPGLAFRKGSTA